MSFYFLDTSALIKHYVYEVGSSWLEATVFKPAGNMLLISRITVVEMRSALARRKREASIGQLITPICTLEVAPGWTFRR